MTRVTSPAPKGGQQDRRGAREFLELQAALMTIEPKCANDQRFTGDTIDTEYLRSICFACPVLHECRNYARVAKPAGGVWAGRRWYEDKRTQVKKRTPAA